MNWQHKAFWSNYRLVRSRVKGLNKADREKHYATVRGGFAIIAISLMADLERQSDHAVSKP